MKTVALIMAGGTSSRYGNTNKLLEKINGKEVIRYAVEAFEKSNTVQEIPTMKKTIRIEGMMCMHCEASVKKALEALPQVESAVANHETGVAEVTLLSPIDDRILKETVEAKDYTVLEIQ